MMYKEKIKAPPTANIISNTGLWVKIWINPPIIKTHSAAYNLERNEILKGVLFEIDLKTQSAHCSKKGKNTRIFNKKFFYIF